ncbi:MAG: zinc ribbon domain-containing protein [Deltaproteobacteria bacterium]|nr:zinc ribbon domain-containing protein [Deltaproteobacteria bacterium]
MPIYEYECGKCQENFEVFFRSRDEKVDIVCPKCGSKRAKRRMSAFAGKVGNTSAGGGCSGCSATSCGPSCRH